MVGGCSKVVQDIPPFMIVDGNPAETRFINKVGLERRGVPADSIHALAKAHKILFRSALNLADALARLESEFPGIPEVQHLAAFARSSQRGLTK